MTSKPVLTIYHNPRCSKSRATLEILQANDIDLTVINYLETPPDLATLQQLAARLDVDARGLMRDSDELYTRMGLGAESLAEADLFTALAENISLLQRPIVVRDDNAVIGRPPANVRHLLP